MMFCCSYQVFFPLLNTPSDMQIKHIKKFIETFTVTETWQHLYSQEETSPEEEAHAMSQT